MEERRRPATSVRAGCQGHHGRRAWAYHGGTGGTRTGILKRLFGAKEVDQAALDAATIAAVRGAGADLAQPRETRHYLYVPTEEAATTLAGDLAREGREVEARPAATGDNWLVLVVQTMVVNPDTIAEARREFEPAAVGAGGDYDGWEAAIHERNPAS